MKRFKFDYIWIKMLAFYMIILALICFFASCGQSVAEKVALEELKRDSSTVDADMRFKIIKIGNCKYIDGQDRHNRYRVLVHAGDCNNPIHK